MKEKIGQVVLDDTYYNGQDLYTDGDIEDELLEIAGNYPESELNQVIAERKSWPVLYHFSHIRENILNWIPFKGDEKVLEIGSGCGAVTGALCRKAKEVTCIELSKKRSTINALRHRECDNLTILMGNFQEIEKSLTEKYDYITLIGVFEYGEAYIQSSDPYVDFLKTISRHLKPEGKIILAIENRFGLKYWAGCTEDHFGTLFEGLEGYPDTNGVKTFTKKELTAILKEAGDLTASWYFPFPDYKLPMAIYSEKRLPVKGELNRYETNYDRLRLQTFRESLVYDSLLENDMFPEFSNSFLLVIGKGEKAEGDEILYAKFSNERDHRFNIRTEICWDGDVRYVKKVPSDDAAREHVKNIYKISEELRAPYEKGGLAVNACTMENDSVRLEYLEGVTLEETLDGLLRQGKYGELEELLFVYVDKIRKIHQNEKFVKTKEFVEIFGDVPLKDELRCGKISNIDLVAGNLILEKERVSVIDYEWTFDFPIPADFLIYRLIHYYLESDSKRSVLKEYDFYTRAGISAEEQETYKCMERSFQKYMQGRHVPLLSMYEDISPGKAGVLSYYEKMRRLSGKSLQVFFDKGNGFCEEESSRFFMKPEGVAIELQIAADVKRLRLDPGENAGGLLIHRLYWKNLGRARYTTNGFAIGKNEYYYLTGDPQLILDKVPSGGGTLQVEIEIRSDEGEMEKMHQELSGLVRKKEEEIRRLQNVIHEMENTKAWKLYRSVKKIQK